MAQQAIGIPSGDWAVPNLRQPVSANPENWFSLCTKVQANFTDLYTQAGNSPQKLTRTVTATGVQPGATGADNVLASFSIPAGFFSAASVGVRIRAAGSFAANGNTKELKIIFNPASATVGSTVGAGGTTIADTGALTSSGTEWQLEAVVYKTGAAGSNTQLGWTTSITSGATAVAGVKPTAAAATESGAIFVAVTANATTATTDVTLNYFEVDQV